MIDIIRTILTVIFLVIICILSLPILLIAAIVRIFDKLKGAKIAQAVIRFGCRYLMFMSGSKVEIRGRENIPEGAVLFTSNHRSYFDTVMGYGYTVRDLIFIGKNDVMKMPYVNLCMYLANGLFIDRDDIRQGLQVINSAIDYIGKGVSVWICPEGTRQKTGPATDMLPWKHGSFKIAIKSGCPVVPVALYNTREIFEDHMPIIKPQHVVMEYLPALRMEDLSLDEKRNLAVIVSDMVKTKLEELSEEIE